MKLDKKQNFKLSQAVLFIIFNREDTTYKVFEKIKEAKPPRLYVAADGPRNEKESEICKNVREIVSCIDWQCEVFTLFRSHNLGCKNAVSSAIDWFFKHEQEGIIIEDDCLPHPDFFRFCQELLIKYRDNPKIMHIGGSNFQRGKKYGEGSYYFSSLANIWGWASWRRAWQKYDVDMKNLKSFKEKKQIKNIFKNIFMQKYWLYMLDKVDNKSINTWDFQWAYTVFKNNSVAITPNNNMISNIGFFGGTHTSGGGNYANLPLEPLNELIFLEKIKINTKADKKFFYKNMVDSIKRILRGLI